MTLKGWMSQAWILMQLIVPLLKLSVGENSEIKIFVGDSGKETRIENLPSLYDGPYFDIAGSGNVTVEIGQAAQLPCVVRRIGAKLVSWVRKRDSAIMSVDDIVVISDERVDVIKTSYLSQWSLEIKNIKESDMGFYECQVSTEPKRSKLFHVSVKVPNLQIEGSPEIFTKTGSTISLKCIVKGSSSSYEILWYHQISEEKVQQLEIGPNNPSNNNGEWVLENVGPTDQGNYSCRTRHSKPASVFLRIVPGERIPEPMLEEEVRNRAAKGTVHWFVFYLLTKNNLSERFINIL